jgi:hypothetical protein
LQRLTGLWANHDARMNRFALVPMLPTYAARMYGVLMHHSHRDEVGQALFDTISLAIAAGSDDGAPHLISAYLSCFLGESGEAAIACEGAAYGHAFRAAELAYDLGFAGSEQRHVRLQILLGHTLQKLEEHMLGTTAEVREATRAVFPIPVYTAIEAMRAEHELRKHAALYWIGRAIESCVFDAARAVLRDVCDDLLHGRDGDLPRSLSLFAIRQVREAARLVKESKMNLEIYGRSQVPLVRECAGMAHRELDRGVSNRMIEARAASYCALVIRECMVSKEQP